jgi:hypothetical protein
LKTAPTLAEVFERTERRMRADDYRTDKADSKARDEALTTVETDATDLSDLKREHRQKLRRQADAEGPPRPGSARYIREKTGKEANHRTPEAPPSPWVRERPTPAAEAPASPSRTP